MLEPRMEESMATTTKSKTELFDTFVGNVANHGSNLSTQKGRIRMAAVWDQEMMEFFVEQKGETPDVWDQCYQIHADGTRESLGNRCAMISRYAQSCAEALRAFAAREEA
jgi:hypothetical protein